MIKSQQAPFATATYEGKEESSRLGALLTLLSPIKLILILPHVIAGIFIGIGMGFSLFIGLLAVLFTGKFPRSFANFIMNSFQWGWRVQTYYFNISDQYPPFSFDSNAHPAKIHYNYQEKVSRLSALSALLAVRFIMIIPHYIITVILLMAAAALGYLGALINLFTGTYPSFCRKVVVIATNYQLKMLTYFYCLTDKWPKLDFDFEAFNENKTVEANRV